MKILLTEVNEILLHHNQHLDYAKHLSFDGFNESKMVKIVKYFSC